MTNAFSELYISLSFRASLSSLVEPKFLDESSCSMDSSQSFTEKKEIITHEAKKYVSLKIVYVVACNK